MVQSNWSSWSTCEPVTATIYNKGKNVLIQTFVHDYPQYLVSNSQPELSWLEHHQQVSKYDSPGIASY